MKNRKWSLMIAALLSAALLSANAAWAASDHGRGNGNGHGQQAQTGQTGQVGGEPDGTDTVTDDTYGPGNGHNGSKGLLKAWENVKDKPASDVISGLLENNYGIDVMIDDLSAQAAGTLDTGDATTQDPASSTDASSLTRDQVKQLAQALKAKWQSGSDTSDTELPKLVDLLSGTGATQDAADVQKSVVQEHVNDLQGYVKLGRLLDKMGDTGVKAYVDGQLIQSDVPPVVKKGHTLVPFRAISNALKAQVSWDEATSTVTVTRDGIVIKLVLGSSTALVNGQEVPLDSPAITIDDRTMVPLRFLAETFDANVQWDDETQSAVIVDSSTGA